MANAVIILKTNLGLCKEQEKRGQANETQEVLQRQGPWVSAKTFPTCRGPRTISCIIGGPSYSTCLLPCPNLQLAHPWGSEALPKPLMDRGGGDERSEKDPRRSETTAGTILTPILTYDSNVIVAC